MNGSPDILDEYDHEPIPRSRFYIPIIILSGIFLCFLVLGLFMDIESLRWEGFNTDWVDILLSAIVPGCGLAFFIAKTRAGWFISTVFISFIVFAGIASIIHSAIFNDNDSILTDIGGRQIFIFTITTTIFILLQTKSIRLGWKINILLWLTAMLISSGLAFAIIFWG